MEKRVLGRERGFFRLIIFFFTIYEFVKWLSDYSNLSYDCLLICSKLFKYIFNYSFKESILNLSFKILNSYLFIHFVLKDKFVMWLSGACWGQK